MTAPPAPLAEAGGAAHGGDGTCRNCGALAPSRFCPACGQGTTLHPPTVREFLHEFVNHSIAFEGALWRTLVALLVTPGRLTVDYFEGRRARYIAPLRLYLTFSLIFFAVNGLTGGEMRFGDQAIRFELPDGRDVEASDTVIAPPISTKNPTGISFIDNAVTRVSALTPAERSAHLRNGMHAYLPYVLIVLVPVLALYLKLLYRNRRRLYGEHLVVAFHAQTVAFVFALVSIIPLGEIFGFVVQIVFLAQGFVALRRVYGGRILPTLVRELLLFALYGFSVALAVALLASISLMFGS